MRNGQTKHTSTQNKQPQQHQTQHIYFEKEQTQNNGEKTNQKPKQKHE